MNLKYASLLICLLGLSRVQAGEADNLQGLVKVKDLDVIGLERKDVVSDFATNVELDQEEYVYFKTHQEKNIIDISTFDGHFRSFNGSQAGTPKNLIIEARFSPKIER